MKPTPTVRSGRTSPGYRPRWPASLDEWATPHRVADTADALTAWEGAARIKGTVAALDLADAILAARHTIEALATKAGLDITWMGDTPPAPPSRRYHERVPATQREHDAAAWARHQARRRHAETTTRHEDTPRPRTAGTEPGEG